jgi:cyclopropane fatty-acyl-phospholipid synthase-like methyltransferase
VSWLTVLHFSQAQRAQLFSNCFRLLAPGGFFFAEDYFESSEGALTTSERAVLADDVFCEYLPTRHAYEEQLKAAGFEIVEWKYMIGEWRAFTTQRAAAALASSKGADAALLGERCAGGLAYFYGKIDELLRGGHVGGARIIARRPARKVRRDVQW